MSNVSSRHAVIPYVAGTSTPFSGQRLSVVRYRKTEKAAAEGKDQLPAVCASVPWVAPAEITASLSQLMPAIADMLADAQDGILKARYEASQGALTDITDDDISVAACISFMAARTTGATRLTKEAVESWFDRSMHDPLYLLIAEKLGYADITPAAHDTVEKHVRIYRDVFALLAGKTVLAVKQRESLKVALGLPDVSPDDAIAVALRERIVAQESRGKVDMLSLL